MVNPKPDRGRLHGSKSLGSSEPGERSTGGERREGILAVAIECFARYGVHRTRMEDVSDAAGISRPGLYTEFANRQELIDAVVRKQLDCAVSEVGPVIWKMDSLTQAIVEGSVLLIQTARRDAVYVDLLSRVHRDRLTELARGTLPLTRDSSHALWRPVLDGARRRGELRPDLNDEDVIEWISSAHLPFLLGESTDYTRLRKVLRLFIAPALIIEKDA